MRPDSIICWKWQPAPGYRSKFSSAHVNTLQSMVKRHYPHPHDFVCVTDNPAGLNKDVRVVPLWNEFADVPSPHGGKNPSCYRRLRAFSPDARKWFGDRFVSIDLDTVIVGDLTPLFERDDDFIIWGETDPRSFYNGSMWMMTAGVRKQVYEEFNPRVSPMAAKRAGRFGSDQGWISYRLGRGEAMWGRKDGVYSFRVHLKNGRVPLPDDARIVMFHGGTDPDDPGAQQFPWVAENYQ